MKNGKLIFAFKKEKVKHLIFFFTLLLNSVALYSEAIVAYETGVVHTSNVQTNRIVKGKVSDINGNPIPGVAIMVAGSTRGVTTDLDGSYSIDVKPTD